MKETVITWFKTKFLNILKEGLKVFVEFIWDSIKEDVQNSINTFIKELKEFVKTDEYENKKEDIINKIMSNIKLPLIAKPFKGLIKRGIEKKIDSFIEEALNKA